jgi:hypothetical protein
MNEKAEKYLRHADQCQQEAARTFDKRDRERYLKIAEYWLKMVKTARREDKNVPPNPKGESWASDARRRLRA